MRFLENINEDISVTCIYIYEFFHDMSGIATQFQQEPAKQRREPAEQRREPAKEMREPAKQRREPAKQRREPAKQRKEPAKRSDIG